MTWRLLRGTINKVPFGLLMQGTDFDVIGADELGRGVALTSSVVFPLDLAESEDWSTAGQEL